MLFVDESPEVKKLRKEARAYFAELMTEERKEGCHARESGQVYRDVVRQMGKDGWLTVGWPEEYGGRGLGPVAQLASVEEAYIASAPFLLSPLEPWVLR